MTNEALDFFTAEGRHRYVFGVVRPAVAAAEPTAPRPLGSAGAPMSTGKDGLTWHVELGAGPLVAALTTSALGPPPAGVFVRVTQPDGTVLDRATAPNAPERAVSLDAHGSLTSMVIMHPQPGTWRLDVEAKDTVTDFELLFFALPTAEQRDTVAVTVEALLGRTTLLEGDNCRWCIIGATAGLAVTLLAIVAAAVALSPAAAPVAATGVFLGLTAEQAFNLLTAALISGANVALIARFICGQAGACPPLAPSEAAR